MKQILEKMGFVQEKTKKDREVWTKEIISTDKTTYYLSYCKFMDGILFVLQQGNGIIKLKKFSHGDLIKDIKSYIKKTIKFFQGYRTEMEIYETFKPLYKNEKNPDSMDEADRYYNAMQDEEAIRNLGGN